MKHLFAYASLASLAWGLPRVDSFAAAIDSGHAHSTLDEGAELIDRKKYAEAVIVLRQAQRGSPQDERGAILLSRALLYSARREEAVGVLLQAAAAQRGRSRAALVRRARVTSRLFLTNATFQTYQEGMSQLLSRRHKAARSAFEKALLQEPDNGELLLRIGQCMLLEGDADSAAERLRLAKRLGPHDSEVRLWLGRALHQRGEAREAVEELRAAVAGMPGSELAPVWLAEALASDGQRAIAIQVLDQDLRQHPMHVLGLATLARLRFAGAGREPQQLWVVKRDLQIALSRIDQYSTLRRDQRDPAIGLEVREVQPLREEVESLLRKVEERIGPQEPSG